MQGYTKNKNKFFFFEIREKPVYISYFVLLIYLHYELWFPLDRDIKIGNNYNLLIFDRAEDRVNSWVLLNLS